MDAETDVWNSSRDLIDTSAVQKSMARTHGNQSVSTYLSYLRKKEFMFFFKTAVDNMTERLAPLEINTSREISTPREQFALWNRQLDQWAK